MKKPAKIETFNSLAKKKTHAFPDSKKSPIYNRILPNLSVEELNEDDEYMISASAESFRSQIEDQITNQMSNDFAATPNIKGNYININPGNQYQSSATLPKMLSAKFKPDEIRDQLYTQRTINDVISK